MNVVKFQTKRRRKPRFSGPVVLLLTGSSKKKSNLRLYVIISKLGQVTMPRQFCLIQGFHGLSIYSEGGGLLTTYAKHKQSQPQSSEWNKNQTIA